MVWDVLGWFGVFWGDSMDRSKYYIVLNERSKAKSGCLP